MVIIDISMIILLVIAIYFSWKLIKMINLLRSSKEEMIVVMDQLNLSIVSAEKTLAEIKKISQEISHDNVKSLIAKAEYIYSDLDFLSERAVKIADRLEILSERAKLDAKQNAF